MNKGIDLLIRVAVIKLVVHLGRVHALAGRECEMLCFYVSELTTNRKRMIFVNIRA